MKYDYSPKGVCPMQISVELDGDVIKGVEFLGGCNGNLKAISRVTQGMTVAQVEDMFTGITCGNRPTSCSDQMVKAVQAAYEAAQEEA